jgi:gas vesicle protein
MNKFIYGIVTGTIIGATFGMLLDPISDKRHKQLSKKKNEMFKTVGTAIDNIMDMF